MAVLIRGIFAAGVVTALSLVSCNPTPREPPRSRVAETKVEDANFISFGPTGTPKKDDQGNLIEQPIAVNIGMKRDNYNTPRAEECAGTIYVRWSSNGDITLTLVSRNDITQKNTTNAKALELDDYQECDIR